MKIIMYKITALLVTLFTVAFFQAQENKIFPVEEIDPGLGNSSHVKIIAFMPSITEETEYASMVIQAFKNYFVEKLAFATEDRDKVAVDVILVVRKETKNEIEKIETKSQKKKLFLSDEERDKQIQASLFDTKGIQVFYGINETLKSQLNLPELEEAGADSVLFLLDENNTIVWRDDHYRGQGEHLKPMEYKVKNLLHIPYPQITFSEVSLKVGDNAPDVSIDGKKLSDYFGSIKVLTFYPAAYSGVFDAPVIAKRISVYESTMISCAVHIVSFDGLSSKIGGVGRDVSYLAVSESTPEILENWKQALGTYHIQYVNDPDYSISQAFGAYNPEGYNNRVTVIIDADGKIAYIDRDYKLNKEEEIQEIITKLQSK